MAKFLVTGGLGYIGSTVAHFLTDLEHEVVIFDNASTGHRKFAPSNSKIVIGDITNKFDWKKISNDKFDCLMHFAAKALVSESFAKRAEYFHTNVTGLVNTLDFIKENKIGNFIFSSSCAVFGVPKSVPIEEDDPKAPISPYGETKLKGEEVIASYLADENIASTALRYFNACGAEKKLRVGELHENETHLIPNIVKSIESNVEFHLNGNGFPTPDGTCIRDFIHVSDIAKYHFAAYERNRSRKPGFEAINLGAGHGYSIKSVIGEVEKVMNKKCKVKVVAPRPGDPPELVASGKRAKELFGFSPEHGLPEIIKSAVAWHLQR